MFFFLFLNNSNSLFRLCSTILYELNLSECFDFFEFSLFFWRIDQTKENKSKKGKSIASVVLWQALSMTFVAEWGDRSQITTFSLAVSKNPIWVCVGAALGHFICTGGAVIGGSFIAKFVTEKTVSITGGILFLIFSAWFAFDLIYDEIY